MSTVPDGLRPSVFIGSSAESLETARALQSLLDRDCEVSVWSNGVFGVGGTTLQSLVQATATSDFAIMVVNADDLTTSRSVERPTTRDNVIFELGLFLGALGPERCFMVYDRTNPPDLPSDLLGVTPATYQSHRSGNMESALGAAATSIRGAIRRIGLRMDLMSDQLNKATANLETSSVQLDHLVQLLARSRAVELDIITAQFGGFIDSRKLEAMRRDLMDLLSATEEPNDD